MLNYQTWLENPNVVRVLLVHANVSISGVETTKYLSTHAARVNGIEYSPLIRNTISIDETLSLDYGASISFGDIELANNSGELDEWLGYVWKNRSLKVYFGGIPNAGVNTDLSANFELVFDGVCEDIDSKSRQSINLKIRDKLEKLNTPVSEELIGNYFQGAIVPETPGTINQNRNQLKPRVYGEVHNISPVLTDPAQLEFMVSSGPVEQIIEVLDNGVPVSFTPIQESGTPVLPPGSFRLRAPLQGTCTASVQGIARTVNVAGSTFSNSYSPTVSNTILNLLKFSGKELAYSEIDATSFASLGTEACGLYLNSRTNVLAACQQLAKSAGLTLAVTRTGKVKLVQLAVPLSAATSITDSDTVLNSLRIVNKVPVTGAVKLGYAKNYTILTGLVTGIPEEHKDLFAKEYLETLEDDSSIIAQYGLDSEPVLEGTLLINRVQTEAVAEAKLNLFKTPRIVYGLTATAKFLSLELGSSVQLVSSRYGLSAGKPGIVIATKPNWLSGKIELEVLT